MLLNYKDTIQIYSLVQRQLNTGSLQRSRGKAALWFLVHHLLVCHARLSNHDEFSAAYKTQTKFFNLQQLSYLEMRPEMPTVAH